MKEPNLDEVGVIDDYSSMPKFELQQRAIFGDAKAERIYFERYYGTNKNAELTELFAKWAAIKADLEKNNPHRDSKGRFTFGAGGPQGGGGGAGGAGGAGEAEGGAGEGETAEATDYRGYHTAPRRADGFGAPATDVEEMMPDFYERPNIYTTGMPTADKESVSALMAIRGKPTKPVTIYRAVPEGVDEINPGDWVTMSPTYAKQHLLSNLEAGHVISRTIPAGDLWFDGDSINEFGYDPTD